LASIIFLGIQVAVGLKFSFYTNLNRNTFVEALRYPSFFQDPQKYAQFLSMCSFFFLLKTNKPSESNIRNYLFFLAVVIAMFLTGARAAFSGLCVGLAIVFLGGESKYRTVAIVGGLAGYIIVLLFGEYFPLFNRGESYSESYEFRNQIWQDAVDIFSDNPLLGIGIGNYQSYVEIHAPDQFWYMEDNEIMYFDHPESGYLKMLTEYGLLGLGLLSMFIILPVISALKRYFFKRTDTRIFYFIGAITGWMISYITVYSLSDKRVLIPLTVHICLLITAETRKLNTIYERKSIVRHPAFK
jgi:O-antigen ligase